MCGSSVPTRLTIQLMRPRGLAQSLKPEPKLFSCYQNLSSQPCVINLQIGQSRPIRACFRTRTSAETAVQLPAAIIELNLQTVNTSARG